MADRQRVGGLTASTLHRLLGWRPDSSVRFRHHRSNRLPHDVIVVDETSMVSLTMMARLLEAVRPDARLVLVGDPDQLSSVEAGAVLADLVAGLREVEGSPVVSLTTTHRYGENIGVLAAALRKGMADRVLEVLQSGARDVEFIDPADDEAMATFRSESSTWRPRCVAPPMPATGPTHSSSWLGTDCCAPIERGRSGSAGGTGWSSSCSATAPA